MAAIVSLASSIIPAREMNVLFFTQPVRERSQVAVSPAKALCRE